jgi:Flp pilus assembly protein protease CpaA
MQDAFLLFNQAISLFGSLIAGLWDLKTTEIPDEIPVLIASLGIFSWFIYMLSFGDVYPLMLSLLIGTLFLLFGFILYKLGQWGGGDAALLGAIGYSLPFLEINQPFLGISQAINFVFNLFVFGAIWVIIYVIFITILNRRVLLEFKKKVEKDFFVKMLIFFMIFSFFLSFLSPIFFIFGCYAFLFLFVLYAKVLEKTVFIKRIPTSKLKVGDVLLKSKVWVGITQEELEKIRKEKKYVLIKEGVRFGIAFFIALVFTLFFENFSVIDLYLMILGLR